MLDGWGCAGALAILCVVLFALYSMGTVIAGWL